METILVVGGAGFIGSNFVDLMAPNHKIIVLDNLISGKERNLSAAMKTGNVTLVRGSLLDKSLLEQLVAKVDAVYTFAALPITMSFDRPLDVHEINDTGTLLLLEAARKHKLKKLVYISSSEVYGTAKYVPMDEKHPTDPHTPYAASKLNGEKYVFAYNKTFNLPVWIIRPFNSYGPKRRLDYANACFITRFIQNVAQGKQPTVFGDGKQTRDLTYVSDTARGIKLCSECDELMGEPVNVGYGMPVYIRDAAYQVIEALNTKIEPLFLEARPGDVKFHQSDFSKAKRLVGYEPQVKFDEGLKLYVQWVMENKQFW